MSYSKRYRERTIEYRQAGHSLEATHQVFKVSKSTIQKWEKQMKETGNLEKKDLHRSFRKIDPEKLKAYVAAHPEAYQSEMAEAFGCSESGIRDALRRHKITRKKSVVTGNRRNQADTPTPKRCGDGCGNFLNPPANGHKSSRLKDGS